MQTPPIDKIYQLALDNQAEIKELKERLAKKPKAKKKAKK